MSRRLYVETSALLRALLDGDETLRPALSGEGLFTSVLTFVEAARAIARATREGRLSVGEAREAMRQLAAFERSCDAIALDDEVFQRAREDFPHAGPLGPLSKPHPQLRDWVEEEQEGVVTLPLREFSDHCSHRPELFAPARTVRPPLSWPK